MKKIILLFVLSLATLGLISCTLTDVTQIKFSDVPESQYVINSKPKASQFTVTIFYDDGKNSGPINLLDSRLTVTGLDGEYLDTRTAGFKTINVSYSGVSVSIQYQVIDNSGETWENKAGELPAADTDGLISISTAKEFAALINYSNYKTAPLKIKITADIDLSEFQWKPITDFSGSIDGEKSSTENYKIHGLHISDGASVADKSCSLGLIGTTSGACIIDNLNIENFDIVTTLNLPDDYAKDFGCLIGTSHNTVLINNVNLSTSKIMGNGRLGGFIGQTNGGKTTITNSSVNSLTIISNNPVKPITADGEGDKLGCFIGQAQHELEVTNSKANECKLYGTRDLGGIVGYIANTSTFTKNTLTNVIVSASIPGGMSPSKGTRNLGKIVGTLGVSVAKDATTETMPISFSDNDVNSVVLEVNSTYEDYTVCGEYFGGIRVRDLDIYNPFIKIENRVIRLFNGVVNLQLNSLENLAKFKLAQDEMHIAIKDINTTTYTLGLK